jgi:hypothetical protein
MRLRRQMLGVVLRERVRWLRLRRQDSTFGTLVSEPYTDEEATTIVFTPAFRAASSTVAVPT